MNRRENNMTDDEDYWKTHCVTCGLDNTKDEPDNGYCECE
jgi:hypothetical protein